MQPRIQAIRAISSIYVLEILKPIIIMAVFILVAIGSIITYLSVYWSAWWLIFLVIFSVPAVIVIFAMIAAVSVANRVAPKMNKKQLSATKAYVKNMHAINDSIATPQFMIVFKLISDLMKRRWQGGFIQETTSNSTRLKTDFEALVALFTVS